MATALSSFSYFHFLLPLRYEKVEKFVFDFSILYGRQSKKEEICGEIQSNILKIILRFIHLRYFNLPWRLNRHSIFRKIKRSNETKI
jgi:hypothetical protein